MLGTDKSRGYRLEMICADFLDSDCHVDLNANLVAISVTICN